MVQGFSMVGQGLQRVRKTNKKTEFKTKKIVEKKNRKAKKNYSIKIINETLSLRNQRRVTATGLLKRRGYEPKKTQKT